MTAAQPAAQAIAASITSGMTLAELQRRPALPVLEMRILLGHVLGLSRVQLITQSERALDAGEAGRLAALARRRLAGEPIAYLVGEREFFGLPLAVDGAVLIPRPDTELLVELALERLADGGRVLDLGTGSGAIAVALAHSRPDAAVTGLDVSPAALAVARRNAARHAPAVRLLESDWYGALAGATPEQFELIVSNPPYIASGDRHLAEGDLRFEPVGALTDHADGLSALRRIVAGAGAHLVAGGWLLMEHGYDQSAAVRTLLAGAGYRDLQSWTDLAGIERVSGGRLG